MPTDETECTESRVSQKTNTDKCTVGALSADFCGVGGVIGITERAPCSGRHICYRGSWRILAGQLRPGGLRGCLVRFLSGDFLCLFCLQAIIYQETDKNSYAQCQLRSKKITTA